MAKAKKPKLNNQKFKPYTKDKKNRPNEKPSKPNPTKPKPKPATAPQPAPRRRAELPFEPAERVLLVGEGDFSFSASLAAHHGCTQLTATSADASRAAVLAKYPQAESHLLTLEAPGSQHAVQFNVDATKLGVPGAPGGAALRKGLGFGAVVFNFPHVGGKSTDVNRQVRANQALVVAFLEGCLRVLAPGGKVVVTLFEGQPYELWGLRNLARHVGLRVETSFRFDADFYPGYAHVRTLGNVEGGWKGEDREARMYILRKEGEVPSVVGRKKSRRKCEGSSDDDDEGAD